MFVICSKPLCTLQQELAQEVVNTVFTQCQLFKKINVIILKQIILPIDLCAILITCTSDIIFQ